METNHKNSLFAGFFTIWLLFSAGHLIAQNKSIAPVVGTQPDGSILVPINKLLRPAGFQVYMPLQPIYPALISEKGLLAVKNKNSLDIIRLSDRTILQSLPLSGGGSSFKGICYSGKNSSIYATDAKDRILIARLDENNILGWQTPVRLPVPAIGRSPYPGRLALDREENTIYVTLSRSNSVAVVNLSDTSVSEIPAGIVLYDVILKSKWKVYVSNWGGRQPNPCEPFYNSSGSQVLVDSVTGIASNGTVSVINLEKKWEEKFIEIGLYPSGMVFSKDKSRLFVSCANSDII